MRKLFTIVTIFVVLFLCAVFLPTKAQAATIINSGTCGENSSWIVPVIVGIVCVAGVIAVGVIIPKKKHNA